MDIITNEELARLYNLACMAMYSPWDLADFDRESIDMAHKLHAVIHAQRAALIAWQFQAAGAALENQRLLAVLKSVEEIVLEAPELNMSNFDEDQIYSINEAMISICGILLQESARNDLEARNG